MKTTELRQNNIIGYPNWYKDGKVAEFKVTELLRDNRVEISNGRISTTCNASVLVPIPITEDRLEKSEFVFDIHEGEYCDGVHNEVFSGSICIKRRHGNSKHRWELCIGHIDITFINHWHRLQNLIFLLTGNELKSDLHS